MKRLLTLVVLFILTFTLAGCDAMQGEVQILEVEVPVVVIETEIVEIEVPTVIIETEIVEIELPIIIKEYIEVEKIVEVPIETAAVSITLFETGYNDSIIYIMSKGDVSYVMEYEYRDPLIGGPELWFIQMEYQYLGVPIDVVFIEELSDDLADPVDVLDYDHAFEEIQELVAGLTWENMVMLFSYLSSRPLEYDAELLIGVSASGQLNMTSNYTDVYLFNLLEETTITITIVTNNDLDINFYHSSFIVYDYDWYDTCYSGTSTYTYTLEAGSYLLELENYYNHNDVSYTIIIEIEEE